MVIDEGEWKGWKVWLEYLRDETRLPEYRVRFTPASGQGYGSTVDACLVEVMIACEHDKDFQICVQPPRSNWSEYDVTPFIDGRRIRGCITASSARAPITKGTQISYACEKGTTGIVKKSLRFARLERVEEPGNGVKEDLGTIEVVLSKGAASVGGISLPRTSAAAQSTIDERAKQVSLTSYVGGAVMEEAKPHRVYHLKVDTSVPKCRVRFSYATRDAIKAQLSVAEYNVRLQTEPHVKEEWTRKKLKTNSGDSLKVEPGRALGKRPSIKKER